MLLKKWGVILLAATLIGGGIFSQRYTPATAQETDPHSFISVDRMLERLEALTQIQPFSGWRNSASSGEAEAIQFVETHLNDMTTLDDMNAQIEKQDFHVYVSTEIWESRLYLTVDDETTEVQADSPRGSRSNATNALRFDSDGEINDSDPNPLEIEGDIFVARTSADIARLRGRDLSETILFLDYSAFDTFTASDMGTINAIEVLSNQPRGIVLVTQFSDIAGESHGTGIADVNPFFELSDMPHVPMLYARIEDFEPADIHTWEALENIQAARLVIDVDVFSPGDSQNLILTIPGADSSHAIIFTAHIDSPNVPGALDDGSGSIILLELAQVLNDSAYQPPVDIVLVWMGGHEIGLFGSVNFVATHQDLIDRAIGVLSVDGLADPFNDLETRLSVAGWRFRGAQDTETTWDEILVGLANERSIELLTQNSTGPIVSDNSSFNPYNVPNANLGNWSLLDLGNYGDVHYSTHLHSPYDTIERARDNAVAFENMAHIALSTAINLDDESSYIRHAPEPDKRVVIIATHTESLYTSIGTLHNFAMSLAVFGYDVDLIPYGQNFTSDDLTDADMVIVMPPHDYPAQDTQVDQYDVEWTSEQADIIEGYVNDGGFLMIVNSFRRYGTFNEAHEINEDWSDLNILTERYGVTFMEQRPVGNIAPATSTPLFDNIEGLEFGNDSAVLFSLDNARGISMLTDTSGLSLMAGLEHGDNGGLILVLGDFGMLRSQSEGQGATPTNLRFWLNLIQFAAIHAEQ